MAVGNPEDKEMLMVMDNPVTSCTDRPGLVTATINESEDPESLLLENFDSYMQDIDDRLTISRMVSDSVIKGMVGAVERDAADRIARKESEVRMLKERLLPCEVPAAENGVGVNSRVCPDEITSFLKRKKEQLSSLCRELDGLNKLLSAFDAGHMENGEEYENGGSHRVTDPLHRKLSGSHVFSSSFSWEANGKHEEDAMPENIDPAKLSHLAREGLVDHFKTEMLKMKRNHESKVQQMTEEYFRLKREFLKEHGSMLPPKKDKDLDALKKRIPEVISKLEEILGQGDTIPSFSSSAESLGDMKKRLDALLSENARLKDLLADKKREVECLSAEVFDAGKKISCYSAAEVNLQEVIENLKYEKEDVCIKATICEEVYGCFLKVTLSDMNCFSDDLCTESDAKKVISEASRLEEMSIMPEIENLYLESVVSQGLSEFILIQALNEAKKKFDCLGVECIYEKVLRASLERQVFEKAESLKLETVKNQKLKEEMLQLEVLVEEKERSVVEMGKQLALERDLSDESTRELESLRDELKRESILIQEISEESRVLKSDLARASEEIKLYKEESCKLQWKLDLTMDELNKKEEERKRLLGAAEEKQHMLSLTKANERMFKRQMESAIEIALGIMKSIAELESKAALDVKRNLSRFELLGSEFTSLADEVRLHRGRASSYKQRLERKCLDLKKAETEVDLLGDEVDNLLSLLEKVYIALDHYSPVLKHYPGVMEILKLVKGELSGECVKTS